MSVASRQFTYKVYSSGKMKSQLLVVLVLAVQTWAACPSVSVVESLDLDKFKGVWYQYASSGRYFIKGWDRCVKSNYILNDDQKTFTINNTRIVNGIDKPIQSTWKVVASDSADGKLTVDFKVPILGKMTAPLYVLGTDYENYAVLSVCKQVSFITFKSSWLFTRKAVPAEDELGKIDVAVEPTLKNNGLDKTKFRLTKQENCENPADYLQHLDKVADVIKG